VKRCLSGLEAFAAGGEPGFASWRGFDPEEGVREREPFRKKTRAGGSFAF